MKKLLLIGLMFLTVGCDVTDDSIDCSTYQDLCNDGTNISYDICADGSRGYYVVNGETYYTVDYMFLQECD